MKLKYLLTFFLLISSVKSFSSSSLEELIVNERFDEVVKRTNEKPNPNWRNSFYAAYAHYQLENFNLANLYASKSLLENPLEKNTVILSNAIHQKLSDTSSVEQLISVGKNKLSFIVIIYLLIGFLALFWRGKKMRLFISGVGLICILVGSLFLYGNPLFAMPKISVLNTDGIVRLSPSSKSEAKIDFGKEALLMIVREVGDWSYVKNLSGNSGWVNKEDLIMLPKNN